MMVGQPKNGMGTTSLVLGIIGLVTSWIPGVACFGWIMCILAVIFGAIGIANANKGLATQQGRGHDGPDPGHRRVRAGHHHHDRGLGFDLQHGRRSLDAVTTDEVV